MTPNPLLDAGLTLAHELAARGVQGVAKPKRWQPWTWEAQQAMYWSIGYIPSPGQREFHRSTVRFKVMCAGSRFGKSMVAGHDTLPCILSQDTRTWFVGPTYDLAEKEFNYAIQALEQMGAMNLATVKRLGKPALIRFPWGAEIATRSADTPSSLLGEEVDMMVLAEASQLAERTYTRYLRARLGSRMGRLIVPTTPFGLTWIKDFWARGEMARELESEGVALTFEESVASWQFSVLENPHFDPREYLAAQSVLPPEEFAEQYDGRFTLLTGRVFPQFDPRKHVFRDIPDRLQHLPVYRTIDFGFNDPNVCLWVVYDREGVDGAPKHTFWIVAEHYERREILDLFAKAIRAHEWSNGKRIVATYGDMADAQGRATLTAFGVPVSADATRLHSGEKVPINKSVQAGLSTLRSLFFQGRIRVHTDCKNTIREFTEYVFDEGGDEPKADQDDHVCSAIRYLLHTIAPQSRMEDRKPPQASTILAAGRRRLDIRR